MGSSGGSVTEDIVFAGAVFASPEALSVRRAHVESMFGIAEVRAGCTPVRGTSFDGTEMRQIPTRKPGIYL